MCCVILFFLFCFVRCGVGAAGKKVLFVRRPLLELICATPPSALLLGEEGDVVVVAVFTRLEQTERVLMGGNGQSEALPPRIR